MSPTLAGRIKINVFAFLILYAACNKIKYNFIS